MPSSTYTPYSPNVLDICRDLILVKWTVMARRTIRALESLSALRGHKFEHTSHLLVQLGWAMALLHVAPMLVVTTHKRYRCLTLIQGRDFLSSRGFNTCGRDRI